MPFAATSMQLEIIILSKSERKRQIPYDITYMWNLKYGTNEPIYETEIDSQILPCGCQGNIGMDCKFGTSKCKLVDTEWIKRKILLYKTENHIQYPGINHYGK